MTYEKFNILNYFLTNFLFFYQATINKQNFIKKYFIFFCLSMSTHKWYQTQVEQPQQQSQAMFIDQENMPNLLNVKKSRMTIGDRFVPQLRKQFNLTPDQRQMDMSSSQTTLDLLYKQQILEQQFNMESGSLIFNNQNTFQYSGVNYYLDQIDPKNKNSPLIDHKYFSLPETVSQTYGKYMRKIPKVPFKVLDAPQLQDDFYLNLIDWSHQNILSVALGQCVYLWSAQSSKVTKLLDLPADSVTSVAWAQSGPLVGVGTTSGEVQIWDANKLQIAQVFKKHSSRVGTLCFSQNLLSSGSRDKNIIQIDYRNKSSNFTISYAHKQEVCGLKWSPDSQYLASGGNDNKLYIWSAQNLSKPICKFNDHQAAVKAIAWSPHQHGLLASGGGTADKTIRFWNALEGRNLSKEDTGSQVCNLMFSKQDNELISTHGYSQNQIILWKCKGMKRIATLTGHSSRVLYLAMSPDGNTIVTGAGDETLRFWNIYPPATEQKQKVCSLLPSNISIR
ncbi:Protein FIZZY-RELATED 2 [Paramecium bursaria]